MYISSTYEVVLPLRKGSVATLLEYRLAGSTARIACEVRTSGLLPTSQVANFSPPQTRGANGVRELNTARALYILAWNQKINRLVSPTILYNNDYLKNYRIYFKILCMSILYVGIKYSRSELGNETANTSYCSLMYVWRLLLQTRKSPKYLNQQCNEWSNWIPNRYHT